LFFHFGPTAVSAPIPIIFEKKMAINYKVADVEKKCAICHQKFYEIHNTGRWLCRQHDGDIVDGKFTCCELKTIYNNKENFYKYTSAPNKRGCVPCDHKTELDTFQDYMGSGIVEVPLIFAAKLRAHKASVKIEKKTNGEILVFIRRFDKRVSDRLKYRHVK